MKFYTTNGTEDGEFFKDFFYKLSGNKILKEQIESGLSEAEIRKTWQADLNTYEAKRNLYLLYP
jgi:uncharacterized protein YbbC (DUF1343 family)